MGELTHDIVSLAELQFELFRHDCREGLKGLLIPAGVAAAGGDRGRRHGAGCADCSLPSCSRKPRPVAGGGLFGRRPGRLWRGGGPGSRGVGPHPRSRACFRALPRRTNPQYELDQARLEATNTSEAESTTDIRQKNKVQKNKRKPRNTQTTRKEEKMKPFFPVFFRVFVCFRGSPLLYVSALHISV